MLSLLLLRARCERLCLHSVDARCGRGPGVSPVRCRLPLLPGGAGAPGSRSWERDALEAQDLGEPVEVHVSVEYGESAVLGCRGRNQRIGGRYAVVAVSALGQLAECARRRVGDGAIVA